MCNNESKLLDSVEDSQQYIDTRFRRHMMPMCCSKNHLKTFNAKKCVVPTEFLPIDSQSLNAEIFKSLETIFPCGS